jgi:hypothetical protein
MAPCDDDWGQARHDPLSHKPYRFLLAPDLEDRLWLETPIWEMNVSSRLNSRLRTRYETRCHT